MLKEFYVEKKALISEDAWKRMISVIRSSIEQTPKGEEVTPALLAEEVVRAVKERIPSEKFGVLFSGGVDSSLIALILKQAGCEFICYTLGFKNEDTKEPEDVEAAEKTAKLLGLTLKKKILDVQEAEELIAKTVKILGPELNNVVNVGVAGVELGCIEMAKEDGVEYLFTGLGSEEIFAGYERHKLAADAHEECWKGLLAMYGRDLLRDNAIAKSERIAFMTPFLDHKLIAEAMRIPAEQKISQEHSKLILRQVAEKLGLPKEAAWRKKRAAQYGSRLDKAIDKIARKKGFGFKKDYLKSLE